MPAVTRPRERLADFVPHGRLEALDEVRRELQRRAMVGARQPPSVRFVERLTIQLADRAPQPTGAGGASIADPGSRATAKARTSASPTPPPSTPAHHRGSRAAPTALSSLGRDSATAVRPTTANGTATRAGTALPLSSASTR